MIRKELCKIISQKEIAEDIYELTVEGELVGQITIRAYSSLKWMGSTFTKTY
jgi:hypothetical protein